MAVLLLACWIFFFVIFLLAGKMLPWFDFLEGIIKFLFSKIAEIIADISYFIAQKLVGKGTTFYGEATINDVVACIVCSIISMGILLGRIILTFELKNL